VATTQRLPGSRARAVVQTMRPKFLLLTLVCVLLGAASASAVGAPMDAVRVALALVGALCAHISVNTLNEYFDFRSGLDLKTVRTAFSGGSGALPRHPALSGAVLLLGLASLAVTVGIGTYFLWACGAPVLWTGVIGLALILGYSGWINRSPLLCLVAPGLGFGLLMVTGTHAVLSGSHAPVAWLVALVPFFLVNNLLLLNQYPDRDADASVGRRHVLIAYGVRSANFAYALFVLAAYATVVLLVEEHWIAPLGLVAVLPSALSVFAWTGAVKHGVGIGDHPRYLHANVAAALLTPLLIAVALYLPP
jgi:1,4-dihydroxy-2-naphthoate octaprenyltransferase